MTASRRQFLAASAVAVTAPLLEEPPKGELLWEKAPFPSCHASAIVELSPDELLVAYFAGSDEGEKDVAIWLSRGKRSGDGTWTWAAPELAHREPNTPCWNPVLFLAADGKGGKELLLFFKAGANPREWSGLLKRSGDLGKTWSKAELLPAGILGPIRAKPVQLANGRLVCGSSIESYKTWTIWMETTPDLGKTWSKVGPIHAKGLINGCIQPAPFVLDASTPGKEKLAFLARSKGLPKILRSESTDGGRTWSMCEPINLPNPNAGVDAVRLPDGRIAVIYNHAIVGRTPLQIALSADEGKTFKPSVVLENAPGEYSYPALIVGSNGRLHATYTWKRERIKHVEIRLSALT
jgi:predicted neuraminidase